MRASTKAARFPPRRPSAVDFAFREGKRFDSQTGSEWNLLGEAVAGPLKGKCLPAVESGVHFAFAWLAPYESWLAGRPSAPPRSPARHA